MTVRVFLVEDIPQMQGLLADLLEDVGDFSIAGAVRTEAEARLWLDDHPDGWDLSVVDLVLDQGSGMGIIAHARAEADRTGGNVVVFSDYASDGIRQHCLNLGADAVFAKAAEMHAFMAYCGALDGSRRAAP